MLAINYTPVGGLNLRLAYCDELAGLTCCACAKPDGL